MANRNRVETLANPRRPCQRICYCFFFIRSARRRIAAIRSLRGRITSHRIALIRALGAIGAAACARDWLADRRPCAEAAAARDGRVAAAGHRLAAQTIGVAAPVDADSHKPHHWSRRQRGAGRCESDGPSGALAAGGPMGQLVRPPASGSGRLPIGPAARVDIMAATRAVRAPAVRLAHWAPSWPSSLEPEVRRPSCGSGDCDSQR